MKVLVCGGRNFDQYDTVSEALDKVHAEKKITHLIHGGAQGADSLAALWASRQGIQEVHCPPNWEKYGKSAGPIRNRAMLDLGPDLVVAFPGGRGTAHMMELAWQAKVKVITAQDVICQSLRAV